MIQMLLQPVSFSDLLSCLGYAAAYETFSAGCGQN